MSRWRDASCIVPDGFFSNPPKTSILGYHLPPLRGWFLFSAYPGLAPWAVLFRRFAAAVWRVVLHALAIKLERATSGAESRFEDGGL